SVLRHGLSPAGAKLDCRSREPAEHRADFRGPNAAERSSFPYPPCGCVLKGRSRNQFTSKRYFIVRNPDVRFGSKADIAHRPDGYTGSTKAGFGGGLDYPRRRLTCRPPSSIG